VPAEKPEPFRCGVQDPPLEAATEPEPLELPTPVDAPKPVSPDELRLLALLLVLLAAVLVVVLWAAIAAAVPPAPTRAAAASDAVRTRTRRVPGRRMGSGSGLVHCVVIAPPRSATRASVGRRCREPPSPR
jgi:hypothetical protein